MTGLDITPHGVHRTLRTRNIVIGATVGLALVVGVGTVAARGDPSVEKVASTSPIASSGSVYTQPAYVPSTPVFPPAPIVPTPKATPVYTPPAPVYKAPAPVHTTAPAPVQSPPTPPKSGPEQPSFGDVAPPAAPVYTPPSVPAPAAPKQLPFNVAMVVSSKSGSGSITVQAPWNLPRYSAPENGAFAEFLVSAVGVTGQFEVRDWDFYVRMADGAYYDHVLLAGFPLFMDERLGPQKSFGGYIVFDVPKGAGTLVYAPEDRTLAEWQFNSLDEPTTGT